ncbi:hypothetical protein PO909_031264 [Leuciscus waleckii]
MFRTSVFVSSSCSCCVCPGCFFVDIQPNWHSDKQSYIMYHGTTMWNAMRIMSEGFSPSADGMLGPGVYVTRSFEKASRYPLHSNGEMLAVLRLSVRVGRVKKIDYQGHPLQKTWYEHGYDTAWVPPNCGMVNSGLEENCVRDPSQITVLEVIQNPRFW